MDAFNRIEPVCRPLLAEVDAALVTLGAPAAHPVWPLLRQVGSTPAVAVAFFAGLDPDRVGDAASRLRELARSYSDLGRCFEPPDWQGVAGEAFAAFLGATRAHVGTDLPERLDETARYARAVSLWQNSSRDRLARALADVIGSADAVAVRAGGAHNASGAVHPRAYAVVAAANIGAHLLGVVATAVVEGADLPRNWAPRLAQLAWSPPLSSALAPPATPSGRISAALDS